MFQSLGVATRATPQNQEASGYSGHPDRHRQHLHPGRRLGRNHNSLRPHATRLEITHRPIETRWDRHRFNLKLVNPANKRKHTIIIVGSGLAVGLAAASPGRVGLQGRMFQLSRFSRAAPIYCGTGRHQCREKLSQRRRQRFPPVLRHCEGRRLPRARSQRLPPGADQRQHHRPMRGAGRAVCARISGLLDNRSFGGAQVSRTFDARGQTGQKFLLGAYQASNGRSAPARGKSSRAPKCSTWSSSTQGARHRHARPDYRQD